MKIDNNTLSFSTTSPQYIELRFGSVGFRKLATCCQLLQYSCYMGLCLYAPALTLTTVTSLPTWAAVVVMGATCTFYTTIVRATGACEFDMAL